MTNNTKAKKALEQKKFIAGTIVDIKLQREQIEKLASDFFDYAVESAEMGQDDYATELLETIAELEEFAENLKFLELKIKTAAITAETMGRLRDLPKALAACRNIFCKGPNFKKLGQDMASLFASLGTAREQFREFRMNLGRAKDPVYEEIFGENRAEDSKHTKRVEDKKKALTAALLQRQKGVAPTPATASANAAAADGATQEAAAKVDAIAALLDQEKKRKP